MNTTDNDKFYRGAQFQAFFKNSNRSLVLKADAPHFTILAVSDTYLSLTHKQREELLEKGLFDVFPGNASDLSEKNSVHSSFMRTIETKATDELPIFKYEIYVAETDSYLTEYWTNVNEPLLDDEENVAYLINTTTNITRQLATEQALIDAESRLQLLNKELSAANEELAAGNEELTATNEILSGTNEKLVDVQNKLYVEANEKQLAIDQLKANEEDLRNAVKHFRSLADIVPSKISNALPSGEVTFFNQNWLDYSGMNFEDLRDFGYHQMMHPDEIPEFQRRLGAAAANGEQLEMEMRFKDINGNYRWHLNIASPVLDEKGQITMWVGSTTDIQRIKEEEQQLQQLLNMLPASVVVIRGESLVVEMINQSNLDYWKKTKAEVIGRKFLDILPDLADQPFAGQLRNVMATGEAIDVKESPVIFENEDGTLRETFVDYTYQALTDFYGNRNGVLVMSTEITERVTSRRLLETYADELQMVNDRLTDSNRELALSEQRFKYLIQEAPVAIGILSGRSLVVSSANVKILEVWGKTEAITGLPLSKALPELEGQPFLQILDDVYSSGNSFSANEIKALLEHQGELKELFFNVVYQPIQIDPGITTDILVVAVDVTEQVNARKRIEQAELTLRLAVDAANVGTWNIDAETRVMTASPRLKELFGFYGTEEVSLGDCIDQICPEHREMVIKAVEDAIVAGGHYDIIYKVEGFHDKKDRWLRAVGNLTQDAETGRQAFTGVIMDVSDIKQEEIRKNDFIGMVSHELKTPLTSLNALLQVSQLKLKNVEDSFLAGAMEKANVQVKRMTTMINGFLNMSRFESGKIHIENQSFDISALVKEVIAEATLTAASHSINYEDCPEVHISADKEKIISVISNLISNGIKYSPKGRNIDVRCKTKNQEVIISVKDEGMGLKPADLEKIFDRYYRVESSHTKNIAGFGIGLYLSSEIVQRHGGRIWAESEIGMGSTFYFSLPLSQ